MGDQHDTLESSGGAIAVSTLPDTEEQVSQETTTTATLNLGDPKLSLAAAAASKSQRRIVKAAHPKNTNASIINNSNSIGSNSAEKLTVATNHKSMTNKDGSGDHLDDDEDDEDEDLKAKKQQHVWESPSVTREMEREKVQSQKLARVKTAADRQRLTRDKKQRDRRLASPDGAAIQKQQQQNTTTTTTTPTTPTAKKQPPPQANPMSRFLSVFSLDSHPEHKRRAIPAGSKKYGVHPNINGEEEEDATKPDEKRPRPSLLEDDEPKSQTPLLAGSVAAAVTDIEDVTKPEETVVDDSVEKLSGNMPRVVVLRAVAVAVAAILLGKVVQWVKFSSSSHKGKS